VVVAGVVVGAAVDGAVLADGTPAVDGVGAGVALRDDVQPTARVTEATAASSARRTTAGA
jgi:hypothetical protein